MKALDPEHAGNEHPGVPSPFRLLYERIFPRAVLRPDLRPRGRATSNLSVTIRWLGTAAHIVETATTTVLIDPFLSRPSLLRLGGKLRPDESAIAAHLPEKVDAVLCGHSHFDHLLDAPTIARKKGARLIGSDTTCSFGRAAGVPEGQLCRVPAAGAHFTVGDLEIRFIPSLHGRIFFGQVPYPGAVLNPPRLPQPMWHYRMGGAFGIRLRAPDGTTVYHNGSADLIDAELAGEHADVLLVGLAGRRSTPDYLKRLTSALNPRAIVPTHHDAFFAPLEHGLHLLPNIDLEGFVADARSMAPDATVLTPDYLERLAVPAGDARGAFFIER